MDAPPVQFARTSDGVNIAYCCLGNGPPIVFASNIYGEAYFYRRGWPFVRQPVARLLSSGWSVVLYDVRGMGASDQPVERLDIDARVSDLEAVVRATGLRRFLLAASDIACVTAMAYAARQPDSVSRLLLIEPWASGSRKHALAPTRLAALVNPGEDWTIWANVLGSIVTGFHDHELGQQLADAIQGSTTPAQLAAYLRANRDIDVTGILAKVSAPALVAHYPDGAMGSLELARDVASGLLDARFMVKDSSLAWPEIEEFLRQDAAGTEHPQAHDTGLSDREIEVLRLLAAGKSNQQIADELVISVNTVNRHVSNIFDKTGVANRAQAAVYAKDHGLA